MISEENYKLAAKLGHKLSEPTSKMIQCTKCRKFFSSTALKYSKDKCTG